MRSLTPPFLYYHYRYFIRYVLRPSTLRKTFSVGLVIAVLSIILTSFWLDDINSCSTFECLYNGKPTKYVNGYGVKSIISEKMSQENEFINNHVKKNPEDDLNDFVNSKTALLNQNIPESIVELDELAEMNHLDTSTLIFKLKAMIQASEERERVAKLQRAIYRHFASHNLPKGLHCLELILASEYSSNPNARKPLIRPSQVSSLRNNSLQHYVIISNNVFATSVVINSLIRNSLVLENIIIHIITDELTFTSMYAWFALNFRDDVIIQVSGIHQMEWVNVEQSYFDHGMYDSHENGGVEQKEVERRIKNPDIENFVTKNVELAANFRPDSHESFPGSPDIKKTKYFLVLKNLRMYLPQVFPHLNKIVLLDDDVVVQEDLSSLFRLSLNGKVNGAVLTCDENGNGIIPKFYKNYFNFSHPMIHQKLNAHDCVWVYGLNIFDLSAWRRSNITENYHNWQKENLNSNFKMWRKSYFPSALVSFHGYVEPMDESWHVLGLGYIADIDMHKIKKAKVIHFNGPSKPWSDLAFSEYRRLWSKYANYSNSFLRVCNIFDF